MERREPIRICSDGGERQIEIRLNNRIYYMAIYKAPKDFSQRDPSMKSVFLAGSIEQGKAIDWQQYCEKELIEDFHLFNPRRDDWDASWKQSIDDPQFNQQVNWELEALEQADYIILYLAENTKSPISLLEFGLHAKSDKLLVVCHPNFWRKGNIDVVCVKYQIIQFNDLPEVIQYLKS